MIDERSLASIAFDHGLNDHSNSVIYSTDTETILGNVVFLIGPNSSLIKLDIDKLKCNKLNNLLNHEK